MDAVLLVTKEGEAVFFIDGLFFPINKILEDKKYALFIFEISNKTFGQCYETVCINEALIPKI